MTQSDSGGKRYLEIDFFRGLALLIIFWNHLLFLIWDSGLLQKLPARIHYGHSDCEPVFIFLSGLVSGIVYDRHLQNKGFLQCQKKALKRSGQIALAEFLTFVILVSTAVFYSYAEKHDPLGHQFRMILEHPTLGVLKFIGLQSLPEILDILPLYIGLMLFVPLMLYGLRQAPRLTFTLSAILYLLTQALQYFAIEMPLSQWDVNVFAWQILFLFGVFVGMKSRSGSIHVPRSFPLAIVAGAIALYSLITLQGIANTLHLYQIFGNGLRSLPDPLPWADKTNLGPFLLLHFFSVGYLVWMALPKMKRFLSSPLGDTIVAVGQKSLFIFCLSMVLDYIFADLIFWMGARVWLFVSFGLLGWVLLIVTGVVLTHRYPGAWTSRAVQSIRTLPIFKQKMAA